MRSVGRTNIVVEMVLLFPAILVVILKVAIQAAAVIAQRRKKHTQSYVDLLRNLLVYHATGTCSISQLQLILPSISTVYSLHCSQIRASPAVDHIPVSASTNRTIPGNWLGNQSTAQVILIFCHGGGFVMPGVLPHFQFLSRLISWTDGKLAVLIPAYSLAPAAIYPTQLGECVEVLKYVLQTLNRSPSEVLIGGDSAGGNLVLAMLSHLLHPHPQAGIVSPLELQGRRLKGAFVIGPWISVDDSDLVQRSGSAHIDIVEPKIAQNFMRSYKGAADFDHYILAATATADWWVGTDEIIEHMLVTAGSEEILNASIVRWVRTLQQECGEDVVTLVVGQGEIHDEPVWPKGDDALDALSPHICQEAAIRDWIRRQV